MSAFSVLNDPAVAVVVVSLAVILYLTLSGIRKHRSRGDRPLSKAELRFSWLSGVGAVAAVLTFVAFTWSRPLTLLDAIVYAAFWAVYVPVTDWCERRLARQVG